MYIAIDLSENSVRVAGSESLTAPRLQKITRKSLTHTYVDDDFSQILTMINSTLHGQRPNAIGFACVGDVDVRKGVIYASENLPEWENLQIVDRLVNNYGCKVVVQNEAVAGALAEANYGAGKGESFTYITWGVGIGGAEVEAGEKILARQIDWERYLADWERLCGGRSLVQEFKKEVSNFSEAEWQMLMDRFVEQIQKITQEFNNPNVILGGISVNRQAFRLAKIIPALKRLEVNLKISTMGDDAGLFGALALLKS
jgi:predicted NBD/HSP70 family sugar kinase